jgi:mRNA interferase RelE/StbE
MLTRYAVLFPASARKDLADLPPGIQERVRAFIRRLADDPRPPGTAPLHGPLSGLLKSRIGAYRVAYRVDDDSRQVRIVAVGHRRDVYERAHRRV